MQEEILIIIVELCRGSRMINTFRSLFLLFFLGFFMKLAPLALVFRTLQGLFYKHTCTEQFVLELYIFFFVSLMCAFWQILHITTLHEVYLTQIKMQYERSFENQIIFALCVAMAASCFDSSYNDDVIISFISNFSFQNGSTMSLLLH